MRKKIIRFIIVSFQVLIVLTRISVAQDQPDQPKLGVKNLETHTYYFDIVDNRLVGDGAKFLTDEMGKNQFVLLGEYHGSLRISQFTRALIPVFYDAGGKYLGLEIGPYSAKILSALAKEPEKTIGSLNSFNSRYYFQGKTRQFAPIPFFGNIEDAKFLAEASKRKLNIIGLDQEFDYGYGMLIDRIYDNLNSGQKKKLKPLYEQASASMKKIYADDVKDIKDMFVALSEPNEVNKFLNAASENNSQNRRIADALRISNKIYLDGNVNRKYLASNTARADYMKKNLNEALSQLKFDFSRDKMLLKIGAVHAAKGINPSYLYDVGNTLNELAAYHGNTSVHIKFDRRFYVENGKEVDALDDQKSFTYRFQPLLQMGQKDRWTVIDLRPLREDVFYFRKYKLNDEVLDGIKRYDLYIIPKQEADPKLNIELRKSEVEETNK